MSVQRMLGLGEKFPDFNLAACVSREKGKEFAQVSNKDFKGGWAVLFFWPLDFTPVCPTELTEFNKCIRKFSDQDARVYGLSADSQFVHLAWRNSHEDLKHLQFPMISDYSKTLATELGILSKDLGAPLRATYIVDPEGTIQWLAVNNLNVGRNVDEVLRTLDALQTGDYCQCNWKKGQKTLSDAA